jgi:hypothetical protein
LLGEDEDDDGDGVSEDGGEDDENDVEVCVIGLI